MEKTKGMVVSVIIDVGKGEHLGMLLPNKGNLLQSLWISMWRFFKVAEIDMPYDPAIPVLGI